ncbi:MAG: 23S rRNA (guanosine(2251)-2'-O)-methyltransferase RlmB [Candidatus Neomarinimicrobiota bacterium]|nr:MAG: 23S rRNA (guanosine(2251)-2'-O)-methyltransferase RlmB [bacterium]|tara:strand:- start:663 stop:1400 length:738 start_codon:yes stop_codon:yes gene_type:complete
MSKNKHMIFGINGSISVLSSRKYKISEIIIQNGSNAENNGMITRLIGHYGGYVKFLTKTYFKEKFPQVRTQGIVVRFEAKIEEDLPSLQEESGNKCILALDRIEDPQNLGQIIRTAVCAGVNAIIIPKHDSCKITDTVIQVSQGAFTDISIYQVSNLNRSLDQLKKDGYWIVAMENSLDAKDWHKIDYKGKIVIVAGSEGRGIKNIILDNCDFQTTIPMQGKINSLNVSAAVSVILFERLRQISN